jgi:dihydroorotase
LNLLLKNINIVSPADDLNEVNDILIIDGVIQKIGKFNGALPFDIKIIKSGNLTCVPGLFDMHVHFRDPGYTEKEDISSGMNAAMNGGFTGVLCMPNTNPPIDSRNVIDGIKKKADGSLIDLFVSACITRLRQGEKISDIDLLSQAGAIAFTDDGSPVSKPDLMNRALKKVAKLNSIILQHAEDPMLSKSGLINDGRVSKKLNLNGIPCESETTIIERDISLTEKIKKSKYHVQHISCGKGIDIIKKVKKKIDNVTAEVCPHHFILTDKACLTLNTNTKMNPPLRTAKDIGLILKGIADDTIDVICTDHAPHTLSDKSKDFKEAPFGIVGLETCVGLTYTYLVQTRIISFEKMIEKLSVNPRKILNLKEIKIQQGENANLTLLNIDEDWIINKSKFKSKSRNTPFDGYKVRCKPYAVINNNAILYSRL